MSKLPKGWENASLNNVSAIEMGQSPPSKFYNDKGIGLPFYQGKAEFGEMYPTPKKWCSEPKKIAEANDILISVRAPVGPTNIATEKSCIGRGLAAIKGDEQIHQMFLLHYFRHIQSWLSEQGTGSTFSAISGKFLNELNVIVPPLNEQKRIADKLDALLARVDECRKHLERVPEIIKRFRQSVLADATSGKLTEDWRREHGISFESWDIKSGSDIFPFITSGSRGWAKYYSETGPIFLRVGNLDHETIELDLEKLQHVTPPKGAEGQRTRIELGDILISITADVGMVGLINMDIGEAYINQHLCLARQTGKYSGEYLAYFLASPVGGLAQLTQVQRGATKAGLTLGDIRNVQIKLPELQEQQEIVRRVEKLFAYADNLQTRYEAAKEKIDQLTPAILAKAFRGELVPQDTNDEPASELLKRIKAARAEKPKVKKKTTPLKKKKKGPSKRTTTMPKSRFDEDVKNKPYLTSLIQRGSMKLVDAKFLFEIADLPIVDFYKQLDWEIENGHILDKDGKVEVANAS